MYVHLTGWNFDVRHIVAPSLIGLARTQMIPDHGHWWLSLNGYNHIWNKSHTLCFHVITLPGAFWPAPNNASSLPMAKYFRLPWHNFRNSLWAHKWNIVKINLMRFLFNCFNRVTILLTSRQLSCREMCKIVTWSHYHWSRQRRTHFYVIGLWAPKLL